MKALTDIPYAREASELLWGKEHVQQVLQEYHPRSFLVRVFHFENRYRTIDALLNDLQPANILELSAGFSFRGLSMAQHSTVNYVDTDLPELIDSKQQLVQQLIIACNIQLKGSLQTKSLNVLDQNTFTDLVSQFPEGPLTIVNEGLLMYLGVEEKKKLCAIIRKLLLQRGGQWVTADIYIKKSAYGVDLEENTDVFTERFNEFLDAHRIEDNKFDSFEAATAFFEECGFVISRKLEVVTGSQLSALKMLRTNGGTNGDKEQVKKRPVIRQTWVLEPKMS
ncbi:MAG: class I SAM-dependent methyltransferase [Chitinophagaceae bacterium]